MTTPTAGQHLIEQHLAIDHPGSWHFSPVAITTYRPLTVVLRPPIMG